jgi:hypothetical protein
MPILEHIQIALDMSTLEALVNMPILKPAGTPLIHAFIGESRGYPLKHV